MGLSLKFRIFAETGFPSHKHRVNIILLSQGKEQYYDSMKSNVKMI